MTEGIPQLSKELANLLSRTSDDLTSTLVNLSGSLKDIECGTHIKIPLGAGYVSYYKSAGNTEKISLWITQAIYQDWNKDNQNRNDEIEAKSD